MVQITNRPRPFTKARLVGMMRARRTQRVFWRHDVDVSLRAALSMAQFERGLNISATYYLMIDSPFYTAADAFLFGQIIEALGHRVGWHLDERNWQYDDGDWHPEIELPVSFHCPTEAVLWKRFPGVDSAYDPIWEGRYFSDSRGRFAYGDPEDFDSGMLQINLHPEWWFEPAAHRDIDDETYEAFFHEPKSELAQP